MREDAMRNILSRNPLAFDTKFMDPRSTPTTKATVSVEAEKPVSNNNNNNSNENGARILAHKLGCKCRKSACMKKVCYEEMQLFHFALLLVVDYSLILFVIVSFFSKYCECYAGNVKCTACCRCIGCKNMGNPSALLEQQQLLQIDMARAAAARVAGGYHMPHTQPPHMHPYGLMPHGHQLSSMEQWGAAESLTFLKRGSPSVDRKARPFTLDVSPVTKASPADRSGLDPLPSLASSSDGTSPGEAARNKLASSSTPEDINKKQDDALLLAAVAMTEFGHSPPPSSSYQSTPPRSELLMKNDQSNEECLSPPLRIKRNINFQDSPTTNSKRPTMRDGSEYSV